MIIVWDCKTGRCEFIELLLKKEGYEVFSCAQMNSELIEQVRSLNPILIISSDDVASQLNQDWDCSIWTLGKEIELPLEPLNFLDKISKKLR